MTYPTRNPKWTKRSRSGSDMIYGIHPILEAIDAGKEIERIIIREGLTGEALPILTQTARQRGIPIQYVPAAWFARLGTRNHQGITASLSPITYQPIETLIPMLYEKGIDPLVIIADGITDVRNLGAIARTAECAGAHALIVPTKGSAQINADAVKTSAGALLHLPVARTENLVSTCHFLKESGLKIVAASERANSYYHNTTLHGPLALVLGDEEKGISQQIMEIADHSINIPLHGQVQSLNVSVAAGILLYEIERQRHQQ